MSSFEENICSQMIGSLQTSFPPPWFFPAPARARVCMFVYVVLARMRSCVGSCVVCSSVRKWMCLFRGYAVVMYAETHWLSFACLSLWICIGGCVVSESASVYRNQPPWWQDPCLASAPSGTTLLHSNCPLLAAIIYESSRVCCKMHLSLRQKRGDADMQDGKI